MHKKQRYTKQGVRDLNPVGHNGRASRQDEPCPHFFGATQCVGERQVWDPEYREHYVIDVYGRKCLHCGETRENW